MKQAPLIPALPFPHSSIVTAVYAARRITSLSHSEHRLVFVVQGAATVRYGDALYSIRAGELLFLKRDVRVELQASEHGQLEVIICVLGEALLRDYARIAALPEGQVAPDAVTVQAANRQLVYYFVMLQHYLPAGTSIDPWLVRIKLLELLYCTGTHHAGLLKQLMQWKQQVHTDIMTVVYENIDNALSIPELARLSGRSLSSFKRDFYAINNMAPSRWIREKKLQKAREMVTNTSLTVADVCYTLGFENVTHFSRIFKSYFGVTPSDCKRRQASLEVA